MDIGYCWGGRKPIEDKDVGGWITMTFTELIWFQMGASRGLL
jgi:hypothetical protein